MSILGQILIVAGGLVFVTAALGIVRFPDVYTRISAVGTAAGVGIVLVVGGALLVQPSLSNAVKVAVIVVLQLATSAIGSMAVARSACLTRTPMRGVIYDDLTSAQGDEGEPERPQR
jgi:multicomponent Na+:H+ antiporter subunit G